MLLLLNANHKFIKVETHKNKEIFSFFQRHLKKGILSKIGNFGNIVIGAPITIQETFEKKVTGIINFQQRKS